MFKTSRWRLEGTRAITEKKKKVAEVGGEETDVLRLPLATASATPKRKHANKYMQNKTSQNFTGRSAGGFYGLT